MMDQYSELLYKSHATLMSVSWVFLVLFIDMISANVLYSPKRWYTPEWSSVFVTVLCSLFSVGNCISPVAFGWMESMNLLQFCAVEKTSFYQVHRVADFDDNYAVKLHRDSTYTVQVDVMYLDLNSDLASAAFPLNTYMASLRIFFSEFEDFDCMWNDTLSENPSAAIVDFDHELKVLSMTQGRVQEASKSTRNGKHKRYSQTVHAALVVASAILADTQDSFVVNMSDHVTYDDFVAHYAEMMNQEALAALESNAYPVKFQKDVVSLVELYVRDSIVPFVNRYMSEKNDSLENAVASFVLQRQFSDSDSLIHITERHFSNRSYLVPLIAGGSPVPVTVSRTSRVLFSTDPDVDETKQLSNYQGYGAYSIIRMDCLHLPEVVPILAEQFGVTHTHCVTGKTYLNIYNTLLASPILSLVSNALPVDPLKNQRLNDRPLVNRVERLMTTLQESSSVEEIVTESIAYERSLAYVDARYASLDRFRVLSLGLGGGELHMYLVNHFPTAEVTSVDISEDIFRSSQEVLGLRYGICRAQRLTSSDGELVDIDDIADAAYAKSRPDHVACRSDVVIADAWDFILHQAKKQQEFNAELYYDLFVFDVYDQVAARWNGNQDTVSSPHVDRASSDKSLIAIRSLLRPAAGLAVFHLHDDNQFQHYYDQIVRVFGADQVVLFSVTSNDYMVVAAREKFRTPDHVKSHDESCVVDDMVGSCSAVTGAEVHPCEQPMNFSRHAVEVDKLYGFSHRITNAALYSLNCKDKTDYLLL